MPKRQSTRPLASAPNPVSNGEPEANLPQENTGATPAATPSAPGLDNPLSEREMEVSRLLVTGATNSEIARELTISPHTVKVHLRNVFEKLQVSSRTEASMVLLQQGWVVVPGVSSPGVSTPDIAATGVGLDAAAQATHAPPPDPLPLSDRLPEISTWQRIYLSLALALCLIAAFAPFVLGRPHVEPALLSDGGQTVMGKPSVELLNRWDARTPMSQARSRMAVAMDQSWIYVVGGEGRGGRPLAAVDAYELEANQWQVRAPLPRPLSNSAAAVVNDQDRGALYVAGGATFADDEADAQPARDLVISDELLRYDLAADTWHTVAVLPAPLAGAQLIAQDGALYVLGGWDGTTLRDEVWMRPLVPDTVLEADTVLEEPLAEGTPEQLAPDELDASRTTWQLLTRLPVPMAFFGAALVDNALYVAGGYDGQTELDAAYVYHMNPNRWETLAPLSTPRAGLTLSHDGTALLALGGGWTRLIADHERYDASANQWTTFASPITGEWRHLAAVSRDGVIHLIGGWSGDYLDVHFQYQSSFRALLPVITSD